jgi:hypothetical protein
MTTTKPIPTLRSVLDAGGNLGDYFAPHMLTEFVFRMMPDAIERGSVDREIALYRECLEFFLATG